jgi:hypothetical protein
MLLLVRAEHGVGSGRVVHEAGSAGRRIAAVNQRIPGPQALGRALVAHQPRSSTLQMSVPVADASLSKDENDQSRGVPIALAC